MKQLLFIMLLLPLVAVSQVDWQTPFRECKIGGSVTVYDYGQKKWLYSDSLDSQKATLPASTFKIINSLIALETGVIRDENDVVKWVGEVDTVLYGYRPEIYHDMTVKEAFEQSAGWVYIELAKKIGRDRYRYYLTQCRYGNVNLSEKGVDFWNFGPFAISPQNQVAFLKALYDGKLPFSDRNRTIVKRLMITETTENYVIRAKTGWTRDGGVDIGWWVGYVEKQGVPCFFATRLSKNRKTINPAFAACRKSITKDILRQLNSM
ncbi:penicillin-binding transpeptidase domain-containing protein [Spirosoma spitsbergense]|uniref:penicillin-binding transpeptidase domain-containing protein n=1 Tax=Spirosoma spitsbergense TaxID=431554 RepID=UPI00037A55AC|nr:penicillin-binding transpeptidase domain-containing protein [Spirosoma spitsbergense]